jgi:hypothetical protein
MNIVLIFVLFFLYLFVYQKLLVERTAILLVHTLQTIREQSGSRGNFRFGQIILYPGYIKRKISTALIIYHGMGTSENKSHKGIVGYKQGLYHFLLMFFVNFLEFRVAPGGLLFHH